MGFCILIFTTLVLQLQVIRVSFRVHIGFQVIYVAFELETWIPELILFFLHFVQNIRRNQPTSLYLLLNVLKYHI